MNNTLLAILSWFIAAIALCCTLEELRRDLTMMQQNSYRLRRYRNWLVESADTTSTMRLLGLVVLFICLFSATRGLPADFLIGLFGIWCTVTNWRRKYKKPLVWTARCRRIYSVSAVIVAAICVGAVFAFATSPVAQVIALALMGSYCCSHLIIMGAVAALTPVERAINRRYWRDAANCLAAMPELKIVGITGSYGKTSTKYFLHTILSEHFDTLMTPGSFNTTLGVVRTVREQLKPYHQVFIVEMGAKQPGDIREICDLVHPTTGIVTAVGPQHLESFGTVERVLATKFELVDALPSDGLAVINNDFKPIAQHKVSGCRVVRYTAANAKGSDVRATDIEYAPTGTTFTVEAPGHEPLRLHTRLLGECNISNITAAVVVARSLGVPDQKIVRAVGRIAPVEHRLSVTRTPSGITVIDDAFNSNPVGSRMAMDVIARMTQGRRIVVTPGMIELGDRQHELNADLGEAIARSADIAIIVGRYNRDALIEGIKRGGMKTDAVHTVDTFDQARQLLATTMKAGDTVLYENDLPDTFK